MARQKMTEAEKVARKAQRKADQMNAAAVKSFGPLFAHLAPVYTAKDAYWHQRQQRAGSVGGEKYGGFFGAGADDAFGWMQVWCMRWRAEAAFGRDKAAALWEHAVRVYGRNREYVAGFFRRCLTTTERVVLSWELRFDATKVNQYNPDGRYLVEGEAWQPVAPVMSAADFAAAFPTGWAHAAAVKDQDDPNGLFPAVMAKLAA